MGGKEGDEAWGEAWDQGGNLGWVGREEGGRGERGDRGGQRERERLRESGSHPGKDIQAASVRAYSLSFPRWMAHVLSCLYSRPWYLLNNTSPRSDRRRSLQLI